MTKFRILQTIPEEHAIVVRFWCDELSEFDLRSYPDDTENPPAIWRCRSDTRIVVPVGISEEDLYSFISEQAPVESFELLVKLKSPEVDTSMSYIEPLVGQEFQVTSKRAQMALTDEEIDELLSQIKK